MLLRKQSSGGSWFKASLGKQFTRPDLKKTHYKKGLVEWLYSPEFKPQFLKKKKKLLKCVTEAKQTSWVVLTVEAQSDEGMN
jgi:hypothetical protein